jgi:hypothetical protein
MGFKKMTTTFFFLVAAPESYDISCFTAVKARNMPVTLVFTFLAYTDWSDI